MDPHRREKFSLIGMYVAFYAPGGVLTPFLSIYLKRQAGFDEAAVGGILALGLIAAIFGQFVLGRLSDRVWSKNRVLFAIYLVSAVSAALIPANASFIYTAAMVCVLYFFLFPIQPLTDTIALEICAPKGWNIGKLRVAAVSVCAVTSYTAGNIVGHFSPSAVFYIFAGMTLFGGIPALYAPRVPGHQSGRREKVASAVLLKNRELVLLLAAGFFIYVTMGFYITFFSVYFTSPAVGGSMAALGALNALASLAEIPVFFMVNRILRSIPIEKALAAAMLFLGVRWLLIAWFASPAALLAVNMLHALSFSPMVIFSAYYIDRHVGAELKASGQTLFCMAANGLGRLTGTFGGGMLIRYITYPQAFFISAVLCLATCAVFVLVNRANGRVAAQAGKKEI